MTIKCTLIISIADRTCRQRISPNDTDFFRLFHDHQRLPTTSTTLTHIETKKSSPTLSKMTNISPFLVCMQRVDDIRRRSAEATERS